MAASSNPVEAALIRIATDLRELAARYALVGGLAVSARAEPRLTRDVDLALSIRSDGAAERLVHGLVNRGYVLRAAIEQTSVNRLATVRLVAPACETLVDLLLASSGIEREIVARASVFEIIPGLRMPVARVGHLLAMKVLARNDRRRPQDYDDLVVLLARADAKELALARSALRLIARRGFARGRDLERLWDRLLAEIGRPRR